MSGVAGEPHSPGRSAAAAGRLDAHLHGRRGSLEFDFALSLDPGEVLAVLGPNGAGKSTLLECLAGLLLPTGGYLELDGRALFRTGDGGSGGGNARGASEDARSSGPGTHAAETVDRSRAGRRGHASRRLSVPTARRGIGLLGQDPGLFPHLSARDNVAFGPAFGRYGERMPRARARSQADAWLARVGLAGLGDWRPRELSGGQQQRVAIARALAARPAVLLLDEPLASLDVEVAPGIRRLLREQLRATGTSAVLVSHEVLDAVGLGDRIAVVDGGRIVETGPTAQVLQAPRTPFVAALAGVNLIVGVARDGQIVVGEHTFAGAAAQAADRAANPIDVAPGGSLADEASSGAGAGAGGAADAVPSDSRSLPLIDGVRAAAVFRPSSVIVATSRPEGSSLRNIWSDRIVTIEPAPGGARLRFAAPPLAAEVTAAALADLGLREGDRVWLAVKASEVGLHSLD